MYKEQFIKLKSRDIFISQKNENEIIVKIYIFFLKKKEEIQFIIKKNTYTNKLFYASYNNNKEEEENALIKNDNVTIIKKIKNIIYTVKKFIVYFQQ